MNRNKNSVFRHRQSGAITLLVGVILVLVASMLGAYVARSVNFGQKESNNRYWGAQAHEVAQGNLEHAIAWVQSEASSKAFVDYWLASKNSPFKSTCPSGLTGNDLVCMNIGQLDGLNRDSSYEVSVFVFGSIGLGKLNYVNIVSQAKNSTNNASAILEQKLWLSGSTPSGSDVPLIVNGCTTNFTGNPDIYPCVDDPNTPTNECPSAVAIRSLYVPDTNGDGKISKAETYACLDPGHLNLHGGDRTPYSAADGSADVKAMLSPTASGTCNDAAWKEIFGDITKAEMKKLSDAQAAAGLTNSTTPKRSVYWVDSSSNWHDSLGSESEPVVLVFSKTACASGCPKINGGPTIYGIVYLDTACDGTRSNGWGGATIYGTVAVESDMEKLNSNTVIRQFGMKNLGMGSNPGGPNSGRVLGSWKDWNQ